MKKLNLKLLLIAFFTFAFNLFSIAQVVNINKGFTDALGTERCGTMPAVLQRVADDPAYAAFYNQHISNLESGVYRSADPCATPITVPIAFHFDDSFSCADPDCLTGEVQEAIDALNIAFADNSQNQIVQDLNTACPQGYPLSDISTSTCITFCLATPRAASSTQGLDFACDAAITIGSFCGGINYGLQVDPTCNGGTPPYYSGILNVFVVADNGTGVLGIADGIGVAAANGNGVTVLGEVFGADGGGCISGGPLNTSGLFGGGATLAHEIGHYLGLRHIWGDDGGACNNAGDLISDTPDQGDSSDNLAGGCPTVGTTCAGLPQSCGSYDYYHNFMDYTADNCLVMFTQEQAQVMNTFANNLFGATSAVCYTDPIVLTSLCEQTVCDPACDVVADIEGVCDADGLNYTVTVTITGGTGPFDVNETADNAPTMVDSVLDAGVAAGTYTYTFPAGTNANVVVVDNGVADCFDGEFIFDPCAACEFEVTFDYDAVTCQTIGGSLIPAIPIIVTDGGGIVWIDQDDNTTFDAGADLDITGGTTIGFPTTDLTFTVYDSGAEDCFKTYTVESGNYSCEGVAEGGVPLRVCTFETEADEVNYTCNGDGTATVNIKIDKIAGNLTILSGGATQVSAMADSATYEVIVPVGAGCALTTVVFADDGSDVSQDSGVEITAPANIANMITTVSYNAFPDWGVDINTVSPQVCGTLAAPDDGTDPTTDFCEPTPPATPTAAQCAAISGNIAIIDRGTCAFTQKAENAQACGATAVVICNNDTANPDDVIAMGGTSVGAVTIPTIFLSYNQCLQIYANLNNGPVDMCIGAPMAVPCERTVNIDPCAFVCDDPEYCDNPCYAEFDPAGTGTANAALCITALGCADSPDVACLTTQACDDADPCTENTMETIVTLTNEVCVTCAGTPVVTCTLPSVVQACDDGDVCTENDMEEVDACDATVICVTCAGTPVATCTLPSVVQACDDGDVCTENDMEEVDACDPTVVCVTCAGTPVATCTLPSVVQACDDGDACTENDMEEVDACDPTVVCVACAGTPVATCTLPSVSQACDDGDACTINDMEEVDACDPTVVCVACAGTVDPTSCDPACVTLQACDDADPCTTGEQESVNADGTVCEPCGLNAMTISAACGDPNATNYDMNATCIDNTLCTYGEYCDNPCFAEFTPTPGAGDTPNPALCLTALGCGDSPDAACLTAGVACDDMDCNTENDVASTITETGEVCDCAGTPITVSCDDGCALTTDTYDSTDCSCTNADPDPDDGCALTTDAFDAVACTITNTPNCAAGEMFDATNCLCTTEGISGCLDPCDPNYDATATIDDPTLCAGYDTTCNTDCTTGDLSAWDAASCACVVTTVSVLGCTDVGADNYDPAANCDNGSCIDPVCQDTILGMVTTEETGCSAAGIEVTVYDATGAVVGTATTDANGDYALAGLFPCGSYSAELTANVPSCYSDSGGIEGPLNFNVNGDGIADGANFSENPEVPTLSQWGLISLALLLMIIGSLKMSAVRFTNNQFSIN